MSGGTGINSTSKLSVYDYGAIADASLNADGTLAGGTDNTAFFNSYFADCRERDEEWFIPAGNWRVAGAVSIYTGGRCEGSVLMPNSGSIKNRLVVRPLPGDLIDKDQPGGLTLATVKSWTGCYRRSRKINGLTGRMGQYIFVNTVDQDMIKRSGQPWDFEEGFLVADNEGRLAHSLYADWNTSIWTQSGTALKVQNLRERISIAGLTVILYNDGSGQPTASTPNPTEAAVTVTRCNTDFVDCSVINRSGQQVSIGFSAVNACSVTYHSCYVEGLQIWKTNYGFSSGGCAGVSYLNCSEVYTRRGIDASKSKNISIVGGTFPSGVGAHWAWWMSVTGANLGGTNGVKTSATGTDFNTNAVWVAGGGFTVENCTIHLSDLGSAVLGMRSDLCELGDSIIIRGNTIVFADAPGNSAIYSAVGNPSGLDTGRAVEMPKLVSICDNTVVAYGDNRIVVPYEALDDSWNRNNFPQDIKMSQRLEIRNNQWSFLSNSNAPLTDVLPSDNVTSRIQMTYFKPSMVVGSGIEADIGGFPSLRLLVFSQPESNATIRATGRLNARIGQISGRLEIRRGPGAYRTITYDVANAVVVNANGSVPTYPVVGDETINSSDLSRLAIDYDGTAGAGTVVQPSGQETNLDLHLKSKGTGLVRFGTRTGTSDTAVNGYVTIKDTAGNIVKLATIA